jgi:hypothetical protein
MAALEMDADTAGILDPGTNGPNLQQLSAQVPMLEHRQQPGDPKAALGIIDQLPKVGLNPHYRTPRRA